MQVPLEPLWYITFVQVVVLKYRCFPTAAQETILLRTLDTCRHLYNRLLSWHQAAYQTGQPKYRTKNNSVLAG